MGVITAKNITLFSVSQSKNHQQSFRILLSPLTCVHAGKVLRIFLDEIRKQLVQHYQSETESENPVKMGGVSFIHRLGSSLNANPHFHCVIIEGVSVKNSDSQITFHKLTTITLEDIQGVQERVRLRVLKSFKRSGLLEGNDV
jgi:hypothetical protein